MFLFISLQCPDLFSLFDNLAIISISNRDDDLVCFLHQFQLYRLLIALLAGFYGIIQKIGQYNNNIRILNPEIGHLIKLHYKKNSTLLHLPVLGINDCIDQCIVCIDVTVGIRQLSTDLGNVFLQFSVFFFLKKRLHAHDLVFIFMSTFSLQLIIIVYGLVHLSLIFYPLAKQVILMDPALSFHNIA